MNPYQRETDWHGLYGSSRDDILRDPASVSHPAKMSLRLLSRIIAQMQEWGWLRPGSCLVDPFAGTFSTGITWAALHPENRACGIELEGHFVAMGRQNQAHAEKRLGRPLALTILRGDSRHVAALLAGDLSTTRALVAKERAALEAAWRADWSAVAFQPFAGYAAAVGKAWVLEEWGDRGAVIPQAAAGSPPYGNSQHLTDPDFTLRSTKVNPTPRRLADRAYWCEEGSSNGQIGNLPDREAVALASPPYADSVNAQAHGIDWTKAGPATGNRKRGEGCKHEETLRAQLGYGASPGQIGALPDTAACGSPPYEGDQPCQSQSAKLREVGYEGFKRGNHKRDPHLSNPVASVGSPPYEGSLASDDPDKRGGLFRDEKRRNDRTLTGNYQGPAAVSISSPPYGELSVSQVATSPGGLGKGYREGKVRGGSANNVSVDYGASEGQIGNAPDPCSVSSPPFEAQRGSYQPTASGPLASQALFNRHAASNAHDGYGENGDGQIGTASGETYEQACGRVYQGLADAGVRYLALVVKCPTRDGKLRRLDQLTARLLRAAGYRVRAWRRAWLFEEQAQAEARHGQGSLFGEEVEPSKKVVGRLSFFRRLHLAKGGVAAKWEDVYFAELVGNGEGAAVASPPYGDQQATRWGDGLTYGNRRYGHEDAVTDHLQATGWKLGTSDGQIGNLRDEATP